MISFFDLSLGHAILSSGVIVGNKADLPSKVSLEDGVEYAAQHEMPHCTCSAKNKISVEKILKDVLQVYIKKSASPGFFKSSKGQSRLTSEDLSADGKDGGEKVLGCC